MRTCSAAMAGLVVFGGCTSESTRTAIEAQRRADSVQQAVFERQHEALRVLLFRDLVHRLAQAEDGGVGGGGVGPGATVGAASPSGAPNGRLSEAQVAAVNQAWNDRDLVEFWALQNERSKALRLAGVDAKLYSDQSMVDLLIKSIEAKAGRAKQGIAAYAGKSISAGE